MGTHDVTETPRHSVSVAAAIFDESGQNVLLIKRRDNGHWEPPGGVLELGETIQDGLRREVREETGGEIEIGPLTGVYKNMPRAIIALVFRCRLTAGHDRDTPEAESIQWVACDLAGDRMAPAYAVRIADAIGGAEPTLRTHDGSQLLE
ncbi:NUDIX hydrolase [Terrabacter sp. AAH1]